MRAENEPLGDRRVAVALGDQVEDLALPLGQLGKRLRWCSGPQRCEEVDQAARDRRAEDRLARPDRANGTQHVVFLGILEDIAARARPHRCEH